VDCVGNLETFHAVGVPPLLEMHLEGPSSPVAIISTYLTLVLDAQAVKFVKPVRDWLSIPAKRKVLGIVDGSICFLF